MSRIAPALDDLIGIEDPDDLMVEIIDPVFNTDLVASDPERV